MSRKFNILIICVILSCFGLKVSAQENNKVLWGFKATVDAELPSKWRYDHNSVKMYHNGVGFTIGGISNIYIGKKFYFEPGVSFFYSQYRYDLLISNDVFNEYRDPKLYKIGLEIPLSFGYTFDFSDNFSMEIFTGPQFRYALGGKVIIKDKEMQEQVGDLLNLWDTQRRFDFSWKIGIGFPIRDFTLSIEADLGITNLLKHEVSFRENRIGLGLAYYL